MAAYFVRFTLLGRVVTRIHHTKLAAFNAWSKLPYAGAEWGRCNPNPAKPDKVINRKEIEQ